MASRKFEFCIATSKIGSEVKKEVDIDLEDDLTEEEVDNAVNEIYQEWLSANNTGFWKES